MHNHKNMTTQILPIMNAEFISPSLSVTTKIELFAASKLIVPSPLASIVWKSLRTCTQRAYEIGRENNIETKRILNYQRKLEIKHPTIWKHEKQRREEWRQKEKEPEERRYMCTKCWESRKTLPRNIANVFPMLRGSGGRKKRSLKPRVRSHLVRWEIKHCTPLWRETHFEVKMLKGKRSRHTFWKLGGGKIARHSGAFQVKKCTKHTIVAALLEVGMSTNGTPLWREAQFTSQTANKTSRFGVFRAFWLWNGLSATAACNFLTSELPKHGQRFGALSEVWMSKRYPTLEIDRSTVSYSLGQ